MTFIGNSFAKKFFQIFCIQPVKKNFHFLFFFLITHQVVYNFADFFAYLKWNGQGLLKKLCLIIFWKYFANIITMYIKTQNFANSQLYLQFLKVKLSNDVSFVIFGHQTWDLEREGAKITPPPVGTALSRKISHVFLLRNRVSLET